MTLLLELGGIGFGFDRGRGWVEVRLGLARLVYCRGSLAGRLRNLKAALAVHSGRPKPLTTRGRP